MSANDDHDGLADETEGLLRNGDRHLSQQPRDDRNKYLIWIRWSLANAKAALRFNKVYTLLAFVPLGIAASFFGWHSITVSLFNLLGIIPLSALVSYTADELSNVVGELVGGLINATFGNAVELGVRLS
jgi:hypothetical protein